MDNGYLFYWTGLWCKGRLNQAAMDLCNSMLPHSILLLYNRIPCDSIYRVMFYQIIVKCYINNHLLLFIPLFIYVSTCKHLVNLYSRYTHVDIINEDVLIRYHYTCKKQPLHWYVNHYVLNLLIYLILIGYIIIKNLDLAICLQMIKWVTFLYCHIISRPFHKFRIFILIFKIINFPPIYLKIINLMENICISLTYYVLNIFDCIKLIHSMETTFESLCFIIIYSLGNFHQSTMYHM